MEPRPGINRARTLRQDQTDAEVVLWKALRNRKVADAKFRRQHPIGRYTADFACIEVGLVIELDGAQHAERTEQDAARAEAMAALGFTTLRFWNDDVFQDIDYVTHQIAVAIHHLRNSNVR